IQFPLYAGMFGIIRGSGLSEIIAGAFVSVASPQSFPLIVYYYTCVMNYFVPSGGSKFVIEAPYLIRAAKTLDVPIQGIILPYAWGDMTTNLLQPFWCIPLLTAAHLEFKDILGYLLIPCALSFVVVSIGIYFFLL
ncbi:MAG: short-chain fatty acid transporter, partial [Acidobacteria bacterium]|nr:short-chain fatty acid transporter [Acidobacteriota bacterium]